MKSEFATWRDEITRPKLTIAHRMGAWVDRPQATWIAAEPDPDMFRWWDPAELIAASQANR